MKAEVITGLDGPIYHGQTFFQAGPWNQPLHCPANNKHCHVHFAHGIINLKHSPLYPHATTPYLGLYVPNVSGVATVFHGHARKDLQFLLAKAIDGEYSAITCYQQLIQLAPTQAIKNRISEIREDEIRHFQAFSRLYTQLTGKQHTPKIIENCPNDYKKGLDLAFNDEQETVDFYLEIMSKTDNPMIKTTFSKAARDEQNHAVWFLYFLK